jgi:hypothetical protein
MTSAGAITEYHGLSCYGLRIALHAQRPMKPMGHHGSWLRGVLGHALFRGHCIHPQPACADCALRASCPYPGVFKPHLLPGKERLPSYLVHDWRVVPDDRTLWVTLVLVGTAVRHAAGWIRHLAAHAESLDMGGAGAGRLGRVRDLASGGLVFDNGAFRRDATLSPLAMPVPPARELTLKLVTPLVSKHDSAADPLLGPLRTRIQRLVNEHGDGERVCSGEPPWRIVERDLRVTVIPRGTDTPRKVRGSKGTLRLTALTAEGAFLLAAGHYLHAGAETSLGFGRYAWSG